MPSITIPGHSFSASCPELAPSQHVLFSAHAQCFPGQRGSLDILSPSVPLFPGGRCRKEFLVSSLNVTTRKNFTLLAVLLHVSVFCLNNWMQQTKWKNMPNFLHTDLILWTLQYHVKFKVNSPIHFCWFSPGIWQSHRDDSLAYFYTLRDALNPIFIKKQKKNKQKKPHTHTKTTPKI